MSAFRYIKLVFLLLLSGWLNGQNAPISMIHDAGACPGSEITVPVRVTGFNNIGSMSLRLQYNASSLTFMNWENTSGFPGFSLNDIGGGILVGGGYTTDASGYSIPDDSVFFTITFLYNGGTGNISWIDNGPTCEYTGPFPLFIVLNDIPTSKYYLNGSILPALNANFSSSTQQPEVFDTVSFTDLSSGEPDGWIWNFLPDSVLFVNGTNQNSQNPQVTFLSNGAYSVSFKISNSSCSAILNRDNYLHVGTPGLWTGQVSSDWHNPGNWHNGMVPEATMGVLIPSGALNWPEYLENFTIGVQCFNLTIESNGQMTITGDLIIP